MGEWVDHVLCVCRDRGSAGVQVEEEANTDQLGVRLGAGSAMSRGCVWLAGTSGYVCVQGLRQAQQVTGSTLRWYNSVRRAWGRRQRLAWGVWVL